MKGRTSTKEGRHDEEEPENGDRLCQKLIFDRVEYATRPVHVHIFDG